MRVISLIVMWRDKECKCITFNFTCVKLFIAFLFKFIGYLYIFPPQIIFFFKIKKHNYYKIKIPLKKLNWTFPYLKTHISYLKAQTG